MKLLIWREGRKLKEIPLNEASIIIGRSHQCDVTIADDLRISRRHAELRRISGYCYIVDLGSTNGTFVNGQKLTPYAQHLLQPGDRIQIGDTILTLQVGEAIAPYEIRRKRVWVKAPFQDEKFKQPVYLIPFALALFTVAISIVFLATGAWLPWIKIKVKGLAELFPEAYTTYTFSGFDGTGKFTFAIAIISIPILAFDLVTRYWGIFTGPVYMLLALVAGAIMGIEAYNNYKTLQQELFFGINIIGVIKQFTDIQVQIGLFLTVLGLMLLFIGGLARLLVALVTQELSR